MRRGLVISGGGSKGAWAGGVIEYLIKDKKYDWSTYVGTSTGSMLVPLISVRKIDELKEQYTNLTNSDVFSHEPFNKKGKLKILNALWRVITSKTSLGSGGNLYKRLKKSYTVEDFENSIVYGKDVFVTVTNVTDGKTEYKSQQKETYEKFLGYTMASASIPLIFDIMKIDGKEYMDGGIMEPVPLQKAINEGCDIIDVIVLSAENTNVEPPSKNMFNVIMKTLTLMNREINKDDIQIGNLKGKTMNVIINMYRTPYSLTKNSALFNKEEMRKWWVEGYEYAKHNEHESITLTRTKTNSIYKIKK
jgi:NTE family protein